jgi:hypothetical protein
MCPTCGEGARFVVVAELGGAPLWVCPDGHGVIRRAGQLPLPRQGGSRAAAPALPVALPAAR